MTKLRVSGICCCGAMHFKLLKCVVFHTSGMLPYYHISVIIGRLKVVLVHYNRAVNQAKIEIKIQPNYVNESNGNAKTFYHETKLLTNHSILNQFYLK